MADLARLVTEAERLLREAYEASLAEVEETHDQELVWGLEEAYSSTKWAAEVLRGEHPWSISNPLFKG